MARDVQQRARELFDLALERPEAERLAFVATESANEPEVFRAVARLLDAHGQLDSFLDEKPSHPRRIGRYVIAGELGSGTMGTVFEAIDPLIGRNIALKVVKCDALALTAEAGSWRERFFREVRAAGSLFHPSIVVIFDVGQEGDTAFFAMEKVDGPTLGQVMASGGKIERTEALDIVRQTAIALDYAHQRGVVHRDIKPANIMLANGTTVKVADFSIAKVASVPSKTATGFVWGTPRYMSPEQIQAEPVDGRSDQFSLAVVAYELLTGVIPFQADSIAGLAGLIVHGPRPSARALNQTLPPAVDEVFRRGLAALPKARYASCADFASALATAVNTPFPSDRPVRPAERQPSHRLAIRPQWRYVAYACGVVPVLVLAIWLYQLLGSGRRRPVAGAPPSQAVTSVAPMTAAPTVTPPATKSGIDILKPTANPSGKKPLIESADHPRRLCTEAVAGKDSALLRRAAEIGCAPAMVRLGERNLDEHDEENAVRWFRKAADAGDSSGMLRLGGMYQLGIGISKDDEVAVHWYQKAADAGQPSAMFDLGAMYENGRGVPADMSKARDLYKRAAERGNDEARAALARLNLGTPRR